MTVGERMKARRKQIGMSAEQIAAQLKLSPSTIYRYENGDIEKMGIDKLTPIAKALCTTPAYLMGWETTSGDQDLGLTALDTAKRLNASANVVETVMDDMGWPDATKPEVLREVSAEIERRKLPPSAIPFDPANGHRIPILGRISAGLPLYAEQHIEGYTLTDLNGGAEYFALRVHGDSMNAIGINDGYLIIVRRQEEVENGEVAVILVGDEDATVKRFYSTESTVTLMPQSTNPIHGPQIYDLQSTDIKVLGKVIEVKFTL